MQVDVNGVELKIGDTVRVVDESGSIAFRDAKGQLGTIRGITNTIRVKLQSGVEGSMYGYRFKKVETKVSRIGKKYQYNGNRSISNITYTVVYENEYGVLVSRPAMSDNDHAWIGNSIFKNYIEIIPDEWVVLFRNGNSVKVSETKFSTEQAAIEYGKRTFDDTMIQVVKLQK